MVPKSLSATAIQVAESCPARYKAEHIDRSKGFGGVAASVGSTVHGALELYVKSCYIDKTHEPKFDLLVEYLKLSYVQVFGSYDTSTEEYLDAYEMLERWHKRTSFDGVRVISAEVKTFFEIPTSAGPIPFNYIWDRFDEIKPGVFKVVDYKSNRWAITSADLQRKIQARCYGLAAAIQLKASGIEYDRIWVEFDLLRHTTVGRVFTREDNKATWDFLVATAEDIIRRGENEFEEKLNPECLFCVRKANCNALRRNIMVGGIHSLDSIEKKVDLRAMLGWQAKGLDALIKELDNQILTEARERDLEELETSDNRLIVGMSSRRAVDAEMVEMCIGPNLFEKYGSHSITMSAVDKLLKGRELDSERKAQLRSLIYQKRGNPSVQVQPKNAIDED